MTNYIRQITELEFKQQSLNSQDPVVTYFQNDCFKKGATFSLAMQEQALKYCQKYLDKGLNSLLVQSKHYFTIWIQSTNTESQPTHLKANLSPVNSELVAKDTNFQSIQKVVAVDSINEAQIPKKKVTKLYRGVAYEIEAPDHSLIQQTVQDQLKPRRKYRGQYID